MLDFLLRHLNGRNFVIGALMAASLPFVGQFGRWGYSRYMETMYPPVRDTASSAGDIKALLDKREAEKVSAQYQRIAGLLIQAKSQGFEVSSMAYRANLAMRYDRPGKRDVAMKMLAEVEMAIPRPKTKYELYAGSPEDNMTDDDAPATKGATTKEKTAPAAASAAKKKAAPKKRKKR